MNDEILHADLNECGRIPEGEDLKATIIKIAKSGNLNFIENEYILHNFKPHGCSFILLLRESHFAVHTFPENRRVLIDIATCGDQKLINLKDKIITQFQSNSPHIKIQTRSDFLKGA
ncbi:MAG: S-adenosylmethionine decarboxylase family protein [Candidatus Helarchaeota archaeon]